jgi:hypothetical protein
VWVRVGEQLGIEDSLEPLGIADGTRSRTCILCEPLGIEDVVVLGAELILGAPLFPFMGQYNIEYLL